MKDFLISFFVIVCFCCCSSNESHNHISLSINGTEEIFPIDSLFQLSHVVPIIESDTMVLGEIKDVYYYSGMLYVLDHYNTITQISVPEGKINKQLRTVGRGRNEYISPISISGDSNRLYLLDLQGGAILRYDLEMNYLDRVTIHSNVLDFIKIPTGFLVYNQMGSKQSQFAKYNEGGELIDYYNTRNKEIDQLTGGKLFTEKNGVVFCIEPFGNVVYKYLNDTLSQYFEIESDRIKRRTKTSLISNTGVYIYSVFNLDNNKVLVSYYDDDNIPCFAYLHNNNLTAFGVNDTRREIPFFPRWLMDDYLISVSNTVQTNDECLECQNNIQYILYFYQPNNGI